MVVIASTSARVHVVVDVSASVRVIAVVVVRTTVRVLVASLPAALMALGVVWAAERLAAGTVAALVTLGVGGLLFVLLYVTAARRMRVREMDSVLEPVARRLRGGRGRARPYA